MLARSHRYTQAVGLIVLAIGVVSLGGCRKKLQQYTVETVVNSKESTSVLRVADDIRLVDVSIPVGVTTYCVTGSASQTALVARYETNFACEMMVDFYHLDMERLGWQEHAQFVDTHETLLLFEKPYRWCIVAIRQGSRVTHVTLYIHQK